MASDWELLNEIRKSIDAQVAELKQINKWLEEINKDLEAMIQ